MLAGHEYAVSFVHPAELAFVTLLLFCLPVAFVQLTLKGQTASEFELGSVLQFMFLAFYAFLGESDPSPE